MITNRIFQSTILIGLSALPVYTNASEKRTHKTDYVNKDGTIVVHGLITPLPYSSSFEYWKKSKFSSTGTSLAHTFPHIQENDTTNQFTYYSRACGDWGDYYHPLLRCCAVDWLPALLPIAYKLPSPHPLFLNKAVKKFLTALPRPLRTLVSEYAQNPCALLDCVEGDTVQIFLPNHDNKKVLAQLICTTSCGQPYRIELARGLITDEKISAQLKEQLKQEIEAHGKQKSKQLDLHCLWQVLGPL